MPLRWTQAEPGRVYRKISYGPLLDVFMLDMRSYRGPNGEGKEDTYGPAAYFGPTSRLAKAGSWRIRARPGTRPICRSAFWWFATATANGG